MISLTGFVIIEKPLYSSQSISGRSDDQDEAKIRNRFDEYNQKTAPLKAFYEGQGNTLVTTLIRGSWRCDVLPSHP